MSLLERIFHGESTALYQRGMTDFNSGCYAEALEAFELTLRRCNHPSDPMRSLSLFYAAEAAAELGLAALGAHDPAAALGLFSRALSWNPDFPDLHCFAGAARALLGDLESSRRDLELALSRDPQHLESRCLLALVLHDLGAIDASAVALEGAATQSEEARRPVRPWLLRLLEERAPRVPGLRSLLQQLEADATSTAAAPPRPEKGAEKALSGAGRVS